MRSAVVLQLQAVTGEDLRLAKVVLRSGRQGGVPSAQSPHCTGRAMSQSRRTTAADSKGRYMNHAGNRKVSYIR